MNTRDSREAAPERIALIPSSYLPHVGGVEQHTRAVARELVRRGAQVEVWTVLRDGLSERDEVDGVAVRRLPAPLPRTSASGAARFLADLPSAVGAWRDSVRSFRPGLLHVHCFGPNGVYALGASRLSNVPLVLSLHGETFMDDHDVFSQSSVLRLSLRSALRRAAAITGCSQVTLDDATGRFGLDRARGRVVFSGVALDEPVLAGSAETLAPDRFGRYVFALGRLVPHKGFDLLIDAFARLAPDHPDVGLVIAGDGPERVALGDRAARLGVGSCVALPGRAGRAAVAATMAQAQAFVMPSRVEPFGMVVLEAWRAGRPVVASRRGGPREYVRDGVDAILVDPEDTAALAGALCRLLDDEDLRSRIGSAARARVVEFGMPVVVDGYAAAYARAGVPLGG